MSRYTVHYLSTLLIHLCVCGWCAALRETRLWVPEAVRAGATVKLACDYDLEQAALYSIKWYRGDHEFYRYVPKEAPPTRVFPLPGLRVDVSLSNAQVVTLIDVQRQVTGVYKCEVSADAPLFHTEIQAAHMTVVEAPMREPQLRVERPRYAAGERLRANCSAAPSFPAANITWFLNSQPVASELSTTEASAEGTSGLESALSALDVPVHSAMFAASRLRLRCVAWLFNVYRRSSEEVELLEDAPQLASVLGSSRSRARSQRAGGLAALSVTAALLPLLLAAAAR